MAPATRAARAATESLVAHTCVYDDAIRWSDVDLVANAAQARPAPPKEQLDLARQILTSMSGNFDPTAVTDSSLWGNVYGNAHGGVCSSS